MPDHAFADLALDCFWDDLVADSNADPIGLDPLDVSALRHLQAMASSPVPSLSRVRTQRAIDREIATSSACQIPAIDQPLPLVRFGTHAAAAADQPTRPLARPLATPLAIHGAHQWKAILATAAILLVALGLSIRSLGPGPYSNRGNLSAVSVPTVQPDVTSDTLLEVTLTDEEAGFKGAFGTQFGYFRVPAGSHTQWRGSNGQLPEPRVLYISSGSLTVRADRAIRIVRGADSGAIEIAIPDSWFTLGPGDALLRVPDVNLEVENPGSSSTYLLDWTIGDVNRVITTEPLDWKYLSYTASGEGTRPAGSVVLTLRHVTIAPEKSLSPPHGAYLQQYLDPTPDPANHVGQGSDLSIINSGSKAVDLYVVSLEPAAKSSSGAPDSRAEQTLLDDILPEDQLRTPGRFNSIMGYYAVPVGSRDSWSGPTDNAPEPLVWTVLSGTYTVRSEQEMRIARAGTSGGTTAIAAGEEITLGPGDTLVRPVHAAMDLANSGTKPVNLVVWTLGDVNVQGPSLPPNWDSLPCYPGQTSGTAPTGPVRLTLRLVTLLPQSTLSAPPGAFVQQYLDLTSEAPNLGQKSDYSLVNQGTEPATLYVVILEPAHPGDGATPSSS
jgi:hypothetical protein